MKNLNKVVVLWIVVFAFMTVFHRSLGRDSELVYFIAVVLTLICLTPVLLNLLGWVLEWLRNNW